MHPELKNKETLRLAAELSKLTGENPTVAVAVALRERLDRVRRRRPAEVAARLMTIGRRYAALPDSDTPSPDDVIGYDEDGLPNGPVGGPLGRSPR